MPFKVANSPFYKVEITLPGYGKTPRLSTKSTRIRTARKMEEALRFVWEDGYHELIEALEPRGPGPTALIDLPTLYHAWRRGELEELASWAPYPDLREGVEAFAATLDYENYRRGARHLLRLTVDPEGPQLAGPKARLNWIYEPAHIDACTRQMIRNEDYKPNTVKNSLWGFIAKLLNKKLGPTKAREILEWADRPSADDRRDVVLTAADLRAVISAAAWEVRMFLLVSASTGVDVSPILRIRRRDVHFGRWKLYVQDRKTNRRTAMIDLPAVALYALHLLLEGKGEGERAFSLAYHQIYYRWRKALEAARLTPEAGFEKGVRIKDLRHTFAAHYVQAGGDIAGLMARLRHKRGQQSLQYARYETRGGADMQRAARKMGLRLPADLRRTLPEPGENGRDRPPLEVPVWWFDPEEPPRAREQLQLALTGRRRNE